MGPSKDAYTLIPENSVYLIFSGKFDITVVVTLKALSWEIILNTTGESHMYPWVL